MRFIRAVLFLIFISIVSTGAAFSQSAGSVAGQVVDSLGAIVVGATVTAVSADGKEKQAITNARGEYSIGGLAPGKYTVKATAAKFALYENTEVTIRSGERNDLTILLTVAALEENVEVSNDNKVSTDADNNASATVIKGKDLDALAGRSGRATGCFAGFGWCGSGP